MDRRGFFKAAAGMMVATGLVDLRPRRAGATAPVKSTRVAYLTDAHLCAESINSNFAARLRRAVADINALETPPDFVVFGGDLTQHGRADELDLGASILGDLRVPLHMLPGEHDWYGDLGASWQTRFGPASYAFDHGGIHFVALNSVLAADFWSARGMTPTERVLTAGGLDNGVNVAFRLGDEQLAWLREDLAGHASTEPVVLLSHTALHDYYAPWGFAFEDEAPVDELLTPFDSVVVLHGHTHQPCVHNRGHVQSYGMPATAWSWPYPPGIQPPDGASDGTQRSRGLCGNGVLTIDIVGCADVALNLWDRGAVRLRAR